MCPKKIKIKETALIVEGELAAEDLIYAAVSFSLTIAVHFYGTMIAGIFCIGIVFGFLIRIVQPRFMARIRSIYSWSDTWSSSACNGCYNGKTDAGFNRMGTQRNFR